MSQEGVQVLELRGNHIHTADSVLRGIGLIRGHTVHNSVRQDESGEYITRVEFRSAVPITLGHAEQLSQRYGDDLLAFPIN